MKVKHLDHVGLAVSNLDAALAFYVNALGLTPVRVEDFRKGHAPYPGVKLGDDVVLDLIPYAKGASTDPVSHIAIEVEETDLTAVAHELRRQGFTVESDLARRPGPKGSGVAIVVLDPDGRRVELRYYPTRAAAGGH